MGSRQTGLAGRQVRIPIDQVKSYLEEKVKF